MRVIGMACCLVLVFACLEEPDADLEASGTPSTGEFSDTELARTFGEAVYRVEIESCGFGQGWGSGFAIAERRLVTNFHVVATDPQVTLISRSGDEITGKVIAADAEEDLAVIATTSRLPKSLELDPEVLEGDHLAVLGYPAPDGDFSLLPGSVTAISGDREIRTSAALDEGVSGGAGLTARGKVAGVAYAVGSTEFRNVGLLLSAERVIELLKESEAGAARYDVKTCAEVEQLIQEFERELESDLPPTSPP